MISAYGNKCMESAGPKAGAHCGSSSDSLRYRYKDLRVLQLVSSVAVASMTASR